MATRRRDARLKKLEKMGPVLAGSIVEVKERSSFYLTDKVRGKTRTLCIPEELVAEAREWNRSHKEAKRLLGEANEIQRALLQAEIEKVRKASGR